MKLPHHVCLFVCFFFKKHCCLDPAKASFINGHSGTDCPRAPLNFVLKAENVGFVFLPLWPLLTFIVLSLFPGGSWSSLLTVLGHGVSPAMWGSLVFTLASPNPAPPRWKGVRRRQEQMSSTRRLLSRIKISVSLGTPSLPASMWPYPPTPSLHICICH